MSIKILFIFSQFLFVFNVLHSTIFKSTHSHFQMIRNEINWVLFSEYDRIKHFTFLSLITMTMLLMTVMMRPFLSWISSFLETNTRWPPCEYENQVSFCMLYSHGTVPITHHSAEFCDSRMLWQQNVVIHSTNKEHFRGITGCGSTVLVWKVEFLLSNKN